MWLWSIIPHWTFVQKEERNKFNNSTNKSHFVGINFRAHMLEGTWLVPACCHCLDSFKFKAILWPLQCHSWISVPESVSFRFLSQSPVFRAPHICYWPQLIPFTCQDLMSRMWPERNNKSQEKPTLNCPLNCDKGKLFFIAGELNTSLVVFYSTLEQLDNCIPRAQDSQSTHSVRAPTWKL